MRAYIRRNLDIVIIVCSYIVAHGYLLLLNGVYGDDWCINQVEAGIVIEMFTQLMGVPLIGYMHVVLQNIGGVFLSRVLVFTCFMVAGMALNAILKTSRLDILSRLTIVLFFVLFPVNHARVTLITFPYTVSYCMFFVGFWLVTKTAKLKNIGYRVIVHVVFLISFITNSLLLFYGLVLLYLILYHYRRISLQTIRLFVRQFGDFILTPLLFWYIKLKFFVSTGLYAGYNTISWNSFVDAFTETKLLRAFYYSFIDVLVHAYNELSYTMILMTFIVMWILNKYYSTFGQEKVKLNLPRLGLLGILLFITAVVPYMSVTDRFMESGNVLGKMPNLYNWDSRHQLLVPLGASLILVCLSYNKNKWIKMFLVAMLSFMFIANNVSYYVKYQIDWFKQEALMLNMSENPFIRRGTTFLVRDNALELNANNRKYYPYELSGMMSKVFGDQTRFAMILVPEYWNTVKPALATDTMPYKQLLNLKNYSLTDPQYYIIINKGETTLNLASVMRLKYLSLVDAEQYRKEIAQLIRLHVQELKPRS